MRGSVWLAGISASLLVVGLAAAPTARAAGSTRSSSSTQASTLYVDIGGGCTPTGPGTQAEPYCTIQQAANVVQAGQTVEVQSSESGPAGGTLSISSKGTQSEPISFVYERTGELASLSENEQSGHAVVTLNGAQYVTFSGFTVQAYGSNDGIDVSDSSNITLDDLSIANAASSPAPSASAGVKISAGSSNVTLSRSQISGEAENGVLAQAGTSGVTVTTSRVSESAGFGITLDGATGSTLTSNTVLAGCTALSDTGDGVILADGSSGTVENNVLDSVGNSACTGASAALAVDAPSAAGVTTGYNALFADDGDAEYSWAGTTYPTAQAFQQAVPGQGANDVDLSGALSTIPGDGSQAIDSANCSAPGELSTDILGNPRVRDPLAPAASLANGTCYADRGAYERQDSLPITFTHTASNALGFPAGTVPFSYQVTITSAATSPWQEPIAYTVNFGDGSPLVTATPQTAATHVYTTPGQYTITLTATDTSGSSSTATYTAEAAPASALPVDLSATPYGTGSSHGIWPDAIDFSASWGALDWEVSTATITFGDGQTTAGSTHADGQGFGWHHLYGLAGTYTATVTVTDVIGRTSTAKTTITVGDEIEPTPQTADYAHTVAAHGTVKIPLSVLTGGGGTRGALVNVDVTHNDKAGTVIVYPNGTTRPDLAAVQFQAGQPTENTTLATGGTVDFYNNSAGSIFLTVDTFGTDSVLTQAGYGFGDTYAPVTPAQVLPRTELPAKHKTVFNVTALDGVPANADAVVLDVTESGATAPGLMLAYGEREGTQSEDEAARWAKAQQVTGLATVEVSGGRAILLNDSTGTAYLTADVVGYYLTGGNNAVFLPAKPDRLLKVTVAGKHWVKVAMAGRDGIPAASSGGAGTTAALVTLTAVGSTANGSFTAYADGTSRPASLTSLSYTKGQGVATGAVVQVGKDGDIDLYNGGSRPVLAVMDVDGSFYAY